MNISKFNYVNMENILLSAIKDFKQSRNFKDYRDYRQIKELGRFQIGKYIQVGKWMF